MSIRNEYQAELRSSRSVVLRTAELSRDPSRPDRIDVRFADSNGGRPTSVTIHVSSGVTPSDMRRFAWGEWFRWADYLVRNTAGEEPIEVDDASLIAGVLDVRAGREDSARRPGRRGHSSEHYEEVADLYNKFVAAGARNPTALVAKHHHVQRSTAAGWVRGARERRLLPAGRHGRAG